MDAQLIHIYLITLFSRLSRESLHIEFWTRLLAGWKQTGRQDEIKENRSGRVDGWGRRGKPRACCSAMWRRDHQPSQSRPCIMSGMQGHPAESSGLYGGWDGRSHTNGRQRTLTHARHGAALQKWLVKKSRCDPANVGVARRGQSWALLMKVPQRLFFLYSFNDPFWNVWCKFNVSKCN